MLFFSGTVDAESATAVFACPSTRFGAAAWFVHVRVMGLPHALRRPCAVRASAAGQCIHHFTFTIERVAVRVVMSTRL